MIFRHDEREGRSVYETTDELWRGLTDPVLKVAKRQRLEGNEVRCGRC